jgi:hypothetical protein
MIMAENNEQELMEQKAAEEARQKLDALIEQRAIELLSEGNDTIRELVNREVNRRVAAAAGTAPDLSKLTLAEREQYHEARGEWNQALAVKNQRMNELRGRS